MEQWRLQITKSSHTGTNAWSDFCMNWIKLFDRMDKPFWDDLWFSWSFILPSNLLIHSDKIWLSSLYWTSVLITFAKQARMIYFKLWIDSDWWNLRLAESVLFKQFFYFLVQCRAITSDTIALEHIYCCFLYILFRYVLTGTVSSALWMSCAKFVWRDQIFQIKYDEVK